MARYIKLEWTNSCDLGNVYYQDGFVNKMFIDAEIGAPEYEEVIDSEENGEGVEIVIYQKQQKKYKFEFLAPEYVADAIKFMAMHDSINLTTTDGLISTQIRNVEVNVSWEDSTNQCMALIQVTFQQDDQVVKDNCCTSL